MTHVIAEPQLMAAAAADVARIKSAMNVARAAAAGRTTALAAPAQDEVSTSAAAVFARYGRGFQQDMQQVAEALEGQFVTPLAVAGNAYTQAEAHAAGALGNPAYVSRIPTISHVPPGISGDEQRAFRATVSEVNATYYAAERVGRADAGPLLGAVRSLGLLARDLNFAY
ncbi:PE family protein [Mycobacterium sp.]|uniref:PE family protein n=1 Tax=Mycobacterium sp. TaxID=1785 RepID=UPI0025D555A7|nr:PE family protein [Mycobacterium sp.]MBW0015496.1 PE family protein [Mycobacterium sp.]